jgi:N-hydroxyarylamine O-acetyltransferase
VTVFDTAALDLDAYLSRVGHRGPVSPRLDVLQELALRHPLAIPFENLSPLLGRPVPLDIASLQQKLLRDGRGGWCFEQNVLLGTALAAIGFDVAGLAARVMWNLPAGVTMPRSHMVLRVSVEGQVLIVDAGFGGLTLTGPLRLEADVEQATPHERFRLVRAADEYFVVEARVRDEWKALYRFDLQSHAIADYEVTSWYLSTSPKSHFLTTLVAARAKTDRRLALRNTDFAIHHQGGYTERHALLTAKALRATLEGEFGINVPSGSDVDAVFDRIVKSAAVPSLT